MSVTENFLSGSTVEYDKSLFYDIVTNGKCYIGFAREEPIWGFSHLIKVEHNAAFL